jgi:hypothetical protein
MTPDPYKASGRPSNPQTWNRYTYAGGDPVNRIRQWIAALDVHGKTQLIDSVDFKRKRTLIESVVQWSPDSRYLLRIKPCSPPVAVNGVGTVQALDIATGKSLTIESSRCTVDNGSTGWLSRSVLPPAE